MPETTPEETKNKNAVPLTHISQLDEEIFFDNYKRKDCFTYLCQLIPVQKSQEGEVSETENLETEADTEGEDGESEDPCAKPVTETASKKKKHTPRDEYLKLGEIHDPRTNTQEGLVYIMVIEGRIFKIGQSIVTFINRLGSYNSGKEDYRRDGEKEQSTNSTTNYFVLQSTLNLKLPVYIYGLFPEHKEWRIADRTGRDPHPPPKSVEKLLTNEFKEIYKKLPIGCTQK